MAEIPNAFTDLLRGPSGWQPPDVMYDTLRRGQCLSPPGIEERQHVIGLIEKSAAAWRHEQAQGMVGGTLAYHIAFILMRAGYLNARAGELLKTLTYPPRPKRWWKFW